MAEPRLIQPDTKFIKSVVRSGGADLKKCYQCATCSTICTLSPDADPFPRKQMIEAQWGLKDKLLGDPAIWLCHNCGDCTTYCPRGAKPGEVFGALRMEAVKHFAFPGFMGKLVNSPKAWPVLFLIPIFLFAALWIWGPKGETPEQLEFASAFPLPSLEILFFTITGLVTLAFIIGLTKFVKALRASGADGKIIPNLVPAFIDIMTHSRFNKCEAERARFWGHLLTLWGFAGLAFMGTVVGIGTMVGFMHTPLAMTNPWKIFANICAGVIVIGLLIMLIDRLGNAEKRAGSTYFDWLFLWTLVGVVFTGIASQLLRIGELAAVMFPIYYVHLILIFALFMYAPYSKFAHILYRTVAMAAGRKP